MLSGARWSDNPSRKKERKALQAKALFLDRDGVINHDIGYLYQPEEFTFLPGIFDLCRKASLKGYKIIIVTNQSGIARGYYSHDQFYSLTRWMKHQFWLRGIKIDDVNYCPHHPKFGVGLSSSCLCRKPRPGMLISSARRIGVDLSSSLMVGDKISDMQAARAAGIRKRFLFKLKNPQAFQIPKRPDFRFKYVHMLQQVADYL
jgi:D-glycero-D-manno-heptose 1,7-bisphosphate phosphatase